MLRAGPLAAALAAILLGQQPPAAPIRSRTTLVPVDVRVVDAKGNPVIDLKKEDFTLQEDGAPQDIRLFDARGLVAQFMTYSRVTAAANTEGALTDLVVAASTDYQPGAAEANLTVTLRADRIAFEHASGRHTAAVQIAMFAGDAKQNMLGERWQMATLDLTDANYQTFLAQGASFTQRIPVQGRLRYVKVIAYDYASDRVGTATVTIGTK